MVLRAGAQQLVADAAELGDTLDVPRDEHHPELPRAGELPRLVESDDDALGELHGVLVVRTLLVQGELLEHLDEEVFVLLWKRRLFHHVAASVRR